MPRRLAVARQAGGFDAIGWTLLGFLLGASLAVFALLHADVGVFGKPLMGAASPPPAVQPVAVVHYAPPPAPPALVGAPQALAPAPVVATPVQPVVETKSGVSALANAGAASAHGAKPPPAATASKATPPAASTSNADSEVADDAAAAGMTSRAPAAAPSQSQDLY
jgi:hypothetical protein